jgi:hypothetical protein
MAHDMPRGARALATSAAFFFLVGGSAAQTLDGTDSEYVRFLEERSMLFQGQQLAEKVSGEGVQWLEDYSMPEPRELVSTASVWLLYYPGSVIPNPGQSVIGTWSDARFWDTIRDVGIELLHTNPVKRGGGMVGL